MTSGLGSLAPLHVVPFKLHVEIKPFFAMSTLITSFVAMDMHVRSKIPRVMTGIRTVRDVDNANFSLYEPLSV